MGEIVSIADTKNKVIDLQALQRSKIRSAAGLIAPATEETHCELAPEHAAEPIKSLDDIYAISECLGFQILSMIISHFVIISRCMRRKQETQESEKRIDISQSIPPL